MSVNTEIEAKANVDILLTLHANMMMYTALRLIKQVNELPGLEHAVRSDAIHSILDEVLKPGMVAYGGTRR